MLVFPIYISEGGHIECQFYSTIEPFGILEIQRYHMFEIATRIEDDTHFAQHHLHIGLNAVPIGGKTKSFYIEINSSLIVAGKKAPTIRSDDRIFGRCLMLCTIFSFFSLFFAGAQQLVQWHHHAALVIG